MKNKQVARLKNKPVKWYAIRTVFYLLLVAYGFVMFFTGYIVGEFL